MEFHNGHEMWVHYNKGVFYNPFENLHLTWNTDFNELKDENRFNIKNKNHQDLIIRARDFLMRVRIQDIYDQANEGLFSDLNHNFSKIQKVNPDIPDLDNLWYGFESEEEVQNLFEIYINLLDPFTMHWLSPDDADFYNEKYQFSHTPPIDELNLTFIYEENNHIIDNYCELFSEIETKIESHMPSKVRDILDEYNDIL